MNRKFAKIVAIVLAVLMAGSAVTAGLVVFLQ